MKPLPLKRLAGLEQIHAREPRIHFLFIAADATAADIEEQRNRLIAEGTARATDRFIPFCWK